MFYLFLGRKNVLLWMVGMNPLTVSIHIFLSLVLLCVELLL